MSASVARRATILRKRSGKLTRLIFFARRAGIVLGLTGAVCGGLYALTRSEHGERLQIATTQGFHRNMADAGFRVRDLMIDGRRFTSRDELKAILDIRKDDSIFSNDLASMGARISELHWVKTAIVERRLPDTIYVRLTERMPLALWQQDGKLAVIDKEGAILTRESAEQFRGLLVISGDDAPGQASRLIGMLNAEKDLRNRIEIARWIGNRRWDLKLVNGITVRLPEEDPELAIRKLAEAQRRDKILDRMVEAIDLREAGRIVVQTEPGAVQTYEAGFRPSKNI